MNLAHRPRKSSATWLWWLAVSVVVLQAGCGDTESTPVLVPPGPLLEIKAMSNRADLISGGDALLEIVLPAAANVASLKVDVDGRDVSAAFAKRADGRITGVVTGMVVGTNLVSASATGASPAKLTVANASRGGPVISGPQVTPFFCATPIPQGATALGPATNSSGLGTAATDAQCNIATEYKLYYKSTASTTCTFSLPDPTPAPSFTSTAPAATSTLPANGCFKPFDAAVAAPADLATTVTDAGKTVSYVVRVERGTMNRGIYDIVGLFDPTKPWTGVAPQAQWNGKILYTFGASTGQVRRQVRPATSWASGDASISRGYLFVVNSMTDSSANSNRVMMAETVMMMKEHITDNYGPIKFTMGTGCSGGSINSNMNASIAPGLIDGFTISCAYPDSETTAMEVGDCVQLVEAYLKPEWTAVMGTATQAQINAKKAAINGHPDQTGCHGWYNAFGSNGKVGTFGQRFVLSNTTGVVGTTSSTITNNCQIPNGMVYDPVTNPTGARCSAWDWAAPIFGKAADGIRAFETRDNVGVQYGLKALLSGAISGEEFVTLNEIIGGIDKNANFQAGRSAADPQALEVAYRAGIVLSGKQLAKTAVIDMRGWDDTALVVQPGAASASSIPIHYVWRSFSIRDRLDKEFGDHGNQVMWRFGRGGLLSPVLVPQAFVAMDEWLSALKADASNTPIEQKVRNARPASAYDFCLLSTDTAQSSKITDQAICDADPFLKASSSPRQVAGGLLTESVLKCQLRPVTDLEYGGRLDAAQLLRLRSAFATGVCDWSKPGVGQQAAVGPLSFRAGPGGVALPAAPVSVAK